MLSVTYYSSINRSHSTNRPAKFDNTARDERQQSAYKFAVLAQVKTTRNAHIFTLPGSIRQRTLVIKNDLRITRLIS